MSETDLEKKYYAEDFNPEYGEADVLARKILRDRSTKLVGRNLYKWHGKYYRILNGRVLERKEAEILDEQYRLAGHNREKETHLTKYKGDLPS